MTITQILQKIKSAFYTKAETDTKINTALNTKANDSDVVHKSGDETISGVKNFNDVVLGEQSGVIRIGNNGEGALFCKLYYDGRIYNNLTQFAPMTNNEYNLGTTSNKWKDVNTDLLNGKTPAYADDLASKANTTDTVLKTNTEYTFRNYSLNSLNIDEKYNENYVVAISEDGYGTRPVGGWTNIINFCTYHFITQLCIPIHPNKDTDCMYIRTRWVNDVAWGEWRKSANDNSVVHKSGDEVIDGVKRFSSETVNTSVHAFRHIFGDYGTFWRQDETNLYLMLTNSGDQYGGWNNFRPLTVNLATGTCDISGAATKATNDSLDNKIDATYLKDIAYNTYSRNLILTKGDGTSSEFRVVYSNQAEYAQKDWNGNNITDTYSTKTELTNGLNSKANDANVVHKSGDETINGVKTFNSNLVANNGKDGALQIGAISPGSALIQSFASDGAEGAFIALCNKNDINDEWKGGFRLSTSQPGIDLIGFIDGSLLWCRKTVDCIDSQGDGYIRYSNGLQICFGEGRPGQNNSFPKAFKSGSVPHVNIMHYTSNNMPYSATGQQGTGGATTNATFNFLLWSLSSGTYVDYDECHYVAIGYWK